MKTLIASALVALALAAPAQAGRPTELTGDMDSFAALVWGYDRFVPAPPACPAGRLCW